MPAPATLTGSGPWRGRRRLTALLNQVLTGSNVGIIRTQYITLRVLALRGPSLDPLSATFASRQAAPGSGAGQRRTMMPPSIAVMAGTSGNAALALATTTPSG